VHDGPVTFRLSFAGAAPIAAGKAYHSREDNDGSSMDVAEVLPLIIYLER